MTLLFFEATELDAIALLADTWDNGPDPDVSAQLVRANVRAHVSFGMEKGKGKFLERIDRKN